MRAILFDQPGDPEVLYLGNAPTPPLRDDEVGITVSATAVNRADLLQRRGLYPPPPGASPLLGLEVAGRITSLGNTAAAVGFSMGQRVMALLAGGGYAEQVCVPAGQVMQIPTHLSDEEAAAIPEAFLTAYLNLFVLGGLPFPGSVVRAGRLQASEASVLIHGGASGVGSAALQLCRLAGITALCTVGSTERAQRCLELGAAAAWDYHSADFAAHAKQHTGAGVSLVLDCIGGSYLAKNLDALAPDGRLLCIGLQGGAVAELNLALLLQKRVQIIGSTLRPLSPMRKAALVQEFSALVLPAFTPERGLPRLMPVIDRVLPIDQAAEAHRAMDQHHVGKIVLRVDR